MEFRDLKTTIDFLSRLPGILSLSMSGNKASAKKR
jgi:hypothetical protein